MARLRPEIHSGDLYGELQQDEPVQFPARGSSAALLPGLLIVAVAALAAAWLADHYGFPLMLLGLLIGLALGFVGEDGRTHPGLDFASRHFLRWGIVTLGLQVTFGKVAALGPAAFLGLLLVMAAAFGAALLAARWAGQRREAGILAGGATAICGASAAMALYGVIGRERLDPARFTVTLVGVALASAAAMAIYPELARLLGLSDSQAGFLIGASVHDAAQAIGGAYGYSDAAGADATIVKLARVALLAPIVALVAVWLGGGEAADKPAWRRIALPWFILGFLAVVAANSFIEIPERFAQAGLSISKGLLLLAVTAAAMRSKLQLLREAGWSALAPVIAASLASFAVALAMAMTVVG